MRATEILKTEHKVIKQVLNCLEKMIDRAAVDGTLDWTAAEQMVDFFKHFADGCHHAKEEKQLFPLLEAKGFPREHGPTGVMRHEHELGRHLIGAMTSAIAGAAQGDDTVPCFLRAARTYLGLLREHIFKEDFRLFHMADQILSPEEQQTLLDRFDQVEETEVGVGMHEKYLQLADDLADRFGVPKNADILAAGHACCGHGSFCHR